MTSVAQICKSKLVEKFGREKAEDLTSQLEEIFSQFSISPVSRDKFSIDPSVKGKPCEFPGCEVKKVTKCNCIEGKAYCATHFKALAAKIKKETAQRCKHVVLIGEKNAGDQCPSKATINGYCNRHQKRTTSFKTVILSSVKLPEAACCPEEVKFWANTRRVLLEGKRYEMQKDTGLCLQRANCATVIGAILKGEEDTKAKFVPLKELPEDVQRWCEVSNML